MGTFSELINSLPSFARLLADINQHEEQQKQIQIVTRNRRQSVFKSFSSEVDDDECLSPATDIETISQDSVKWHVYIEYLRAGVGLLLSSLLVIVIFSAHQGISIFSHWWLAEWSDEESNRHITVSECSAVELRNNTVVRMADNE